MELTRSNRIASIDIFRGIIMIIMAVDHTRDFFHQPALIADPLDAATTTAPIYFTRWITHFCAPVFVLLSGVSAFLSSRKKTKNEASLFLIKRGVWLVLAEITLVTFGITFNPSYNFIILQVIWAIGWSMIILGLLSRISYHVVLTAGIILFFGHNILDHVTLPQEGIAGATWSLLFRARPTFIPVSATYVLADIYAILPWTGVMLLGYAIGYWFKKDFLPEHRKKLLLSTGAGLIILFILLRSTSSYGNPGPWLKMDGFLHNLYTFLNTSKYPPSLQYLSMTLGPACILLALLENAKGNWTRIVSVYGKVPFFYYILHFYLIHTISVILFYATGHTNSQIVDPNNPIFYFRPVNFGFGLPVVYLIWLGVIILLYFPCKWYSNYKAGHSQWWLSYL